MTEFSPVRTVADFQNLDEGEMLEGYLDGFNNGPSPNSSHSRSYWHGWRNGMVDSHRQLPDCAFKELAQDFERLPASQRHAHGAMSVQTGVWDVLSN